MKRVRRQERIIVSANFGIGWRQVAASFVLLTVGAVLASTYSVVAVPLAKEFHPSRSVLMLAMTLMSLVGGLISPWVGRKMDQSSLRRLMFIGAGLMVGGYMALSFATSFAMVLVIYAVFMAPANIMIGPMATSVLLSRWFVKRRGAAIGIAIAGVAMGGFIFPPLIQLLLNSMEWRVAFRVLGLIVFIMTIGSILFVVNRPADRGLFPDGDVVDPELGRVGITGPGITTRQILTDPTFWCAVALFAVILSGMKGMVTNLVPIAVDQGITATSAALLISIYSACGFVAKLGFAAVADRVNLRVLMFASLAGFALGMACLTKASMGYGVIALGVGLVGSFGGLMVPLQGLLVPRIYGRAVVGQVAGILNLVVLGALLSTPPIFGASYDLTGSYTAIFMIFVGLAALTTLVVPYIRLSQRPTDSDEAVEGAVLGAEPGKA
jgi:MFS family permease